MLSAMVGSLQAAQGTTRPLRVTPRASGHCQRHKQPTPVAYGHLWWPWGRTNKKATFRNEMVLLDYF